MRAGAKINARRQTRTAQLIGIEAGALLFDKGVEARTVEHFVHTDIEGMTGTSVALPVQVVHIESGDAVGIHFELSESTVNQYTERNSTAKPPLNARNGNLYFVFAKHSNRLHRPSPEIVQGAGTVRKVILWLIHARWESIGRS